MWATALHEKDALQRYIHKTSGTSKSDSTNNSREAYEDALKQAPDVLSSFPPRRNQMKVGYVGKLNLLALFSLGQLASPEIKVEQTVLVEQWGQYFIKLES